MQKLTIDQANRAIAELEGWADVAILAGDLLGYRPGEEGIEAVPNYAGDDTAAFGLLQTTNGDTFLELTLDDGWWTVKLNGWTEKPANMRGGVGFDEEGFDKRFSLAAATAWLRAHGVDCEVQDV